MDKKSVLRISNRLRLRQEKIQNKDSILAKILNYNEQEIYGKKSVENKKLKLEFNTTHYIKYLMTLP